MKTGILMIGLFLLIETTCPAQTQAQAQKVRAKSNVLSFKGNAIIAEENRREEERKREEEEDRKRAEERQLEEAKKGELATIEDAKSRGVEKPVLISQTLNVLNSELPKFYALIIGVSAQSEKEAQRLNDILIRQYDFPIENVTLLIDPKKGEVIEQLDIHKDSRSETDNLLIFYAGRGYFDKSKDTGYWLAADGKANDQTTWITNSEIKDYLSEFKTKHTLLIAETRFNSSIFEEDNRDDHNDLVKFRDAYRNKSRKAMVGSGSSAKDNSAFIESLLSTLEKNQDMFLSSSELFTRMESGMNTSGSPVIGTIRGAGDQGGDFIFIRKD